MTSRINGSMKKSEELKHAKEMGPNWVVIVGGALLCTFSIRLCCRLKQVFDFKSSSETHSPSKENGNSTHNKRHESCKLHSHMYCVIPDEDGCHQCLSGAKHTPTSPMSKDGDDPLPLVKVASAQSYIDNRAMWASVRDPLELPPKPFSHPNSLDSPCISESGSDIYSKREVIQKLRQQLKRRDDMVLEMQAQITVLQNSLTVQTNHTTHLQAQLGSSNQDLLNSDREIKWLQKTISDMCSSECTPPENSLHARVWQLEPANGHANGCLDVSADADLHWVGVEKTRGEEIIDRLKREVNELKEVIEGKEFLIQSYKEDKIELCSKLKELQLRRDSQVSTPNIL